MPGRTHGLRLSLMSSFHANYKMENLFLSSQNLWAKNYGQFCSRNSSWTCTNFYGILGTPVWNQSTTISLFGQTRASFFVFALVTSRKAFGKFVYSWGKLEGGDAWYAFQVMTGFKTCVAYTMRKNKWKKKTLKEDWAHGKTENARGRKINYKCVSPWCAVLLKLWASLQKAERNRHLSTVGETIFGQMPRFQLWLWAKRAGKVIWTEICNLNLILFAAGLTSPKALIPKNWKWLQKKEVISRS